MAEHRIDPEDAEKLEAPERMGRMPPEEVIDLLGPQPGVRCLDLGCGTGYLSRPLARHVAPGGVVALDRSRGMLEEVGRRAEEEAVWIPRIQADGGGLPFRDGSFDRVLAVNLLHELDDAAAVLAEVRRVVGGSGRVVVVDWVPEDDAAGPPEESRLSREEMGSLVEGAGFRLQDVDLDLPYHGAVVGAVEGRGDAGEG